MNVKRKLLATFLASALIGVGTHAFGAGDYTWLLEKGFYGSAVPSKPDVTIKVSGPTKYVYVDHFATVKFENDKGQSFVWWFDSAEEMSYFPLKTIAPSGFDAGNAMVRVNHPIEHYDGG